MPHCIIEYSSNIADKPDVQSVLGRLHELIAANLDTEINTIKSRVMERTDFFVSDGTRDQSFIHLELAAMDGRPEEMLQSLGEKLHAFLKEAFPQTVTTANCSITVEVRSMNSKTYFRESVGEV